MSRSWLQAVLFTLVLALFISTAESAVIVNGSFESQAASVSGCTAETSIPGWNVHTSIDLCKTPVYGSTPPDGVIFSFVGGGSDDPAGFLSLPLTGLTVGHSYTVTFFLGGENYNISATEVVQVSMLSGSSTGSQNFNAPHSLDNGNGSASHLWDNWSAFNYTFVANATSAEVKWVDTTSSANDTGIDNVSIADTTQVSSVPEPGTLVLFGMAVACLGLARRKGDGLRPHLHRVFRRPDSQH